MDSYFYLGILFSDEIGIKSNRGDMDGTSREDPRLSRRELVINTNYESPHPVEKIWKEMECYESFLKHAP